MKNTESKEILHCHAELESIAPNGEQDDDWRLEYEGRKGEPTIPESTMIHAGQNYAFLILPNVEHISTQLRSILSAKRLDYTGYKPNHLLLSCAVIGRN